MSLELCLRRFTESEILGPDEMKSIKKDVISALKKQFGVSPEWKEGKEGDVESLPLGGFETLKQLQRYAAHIDLEGCPPTAPEVEDTVYEDEYLQEYWEAAEAESASDKQLRFRHMIWTGSLGIFYIPVDFPEPLLIGEESEEEDSKGEIEFISVGSSYRLLEELDEINKWLKLQGDYGDLGAQVAKDVFENEQDPWREVKWAWLVLHRQVRQSLDRKLTICFE